MHLSPEEADYGLDQVVVAETSEPDRQSSFEEVLVSALEESNEVESIQQDISSQVSELIADIRYRVADYHQNKAKSKGQEHNRAGRRNLTVLRKFITDTHAIVGGARLVAADKATLSETKDHDANLWATCESREVTTDTGTATVYSATMKAMMYGVIIMTAYDEIGPKYRELYDHRKAALCELYGHLATNPSDISKFLSFLEGQAVDPDPAVVPLLTVLANDMYDGAADNIARSFWSKLETGEVTIDLRSEFISEQLQRLMDEATVDEPVLDVLKFIRAMFPGNDAEFFQATIDHFDQWPQTLKDAYTTFYKEVLTFVTKSVETNLIDKVRKGRFEPTNTRVLNGNGAKQSQPSGNRKRNGGRVTPRRRTTVSSEVVAEAEQGIKFAGFGRFLKTDNGYILERCNRDRIISMIEDYVKRNNSGAEVFEDMLSILDSIFDTPFGDGATPFVSNSKIKLNSKEIQVWHLNPSKRPGLRLRTNNARRSRIKYSAVKDPESGELLLGIVGILHHDAIDHNRITN